MVYFPVTWQVVLFAVVTLLVGIPHGGLDHYFGRALCREWVGKWWVPVFFSTYSCLALLVLAGWSILPLTTIAIFFTLSAIHFGEEESLPMAAVEGGMVIWIPFLVRPEETSSLLSSVTPGHISGSIQEIVLATQPLLWALAIVMTGHVIELAWRGLRRHEARSILKASRLTAFALMFATVPILMSFVLFFCGWHSTRELIALAKRMDQSRPSRGLLRVIRVSAPLSLLVISGTAIIASGRFLSGYRLESVVVQGVFLALSAVAVPHILLHKMANRYGVDPFNRGGLS